MSREQGVAAAFVELADTLVDDFDVIDFLHQLTVRCVDLLEVQAAGIMMTDQRGGLQVLAASSEEARLVELYELQHDEGPCLDAFRSGVAVDIRGVAEMTVRWPHFTPALQGFGFRSAQAIPLRLRRETIGALNLFGSAADGLSADRMLLGRAFADVATIGLLQERSISASEILVEQLQTALNSRVVLEQAKGVLAERAGLSMDEAFHLLRRYARGQGRKLSEVAAAVTTGDTDILTALPAARRDPPARRG